MPQEAHGPRSVKHSAWSIALRSWEQLPVVVRAVFVALLVLTIGQLPPGIFLLANLKLSPSIPWFLPATAIWLGLLSVAPRHTTVPR